jgi:small subunit ribosomal protein S16
MLVIRLQRIGKKHQPSFRVVVAERRSKLGGSPTEDLGSYSFSGKVVSVNKERLEHWLKVGAKPTVTMHNLLVKSGALTAAKLPVKMKKAKAAETTEVGATMTAKTEAPTAIPPEQKPEQEMGEKVVAEN